MSETKPKPIAIPAALVKLHGEQSTLPDVIATHAVAYLMAAFIGWLSWQEGLAGWQVGLLAVLGGDIAGGVVANVTAGTDRYYGARAQLRKVFLATHVIQPLVLWWLFPESYLVIAATAAVTLCSSLAVDLFADPPLDRTWAAAGMVVGCAVVIALQPPSAALILLLVLYVAKLTLCFSPRWFPAPWS